LPPSQKARTLNPAPSALVTLRVPSLVKRPEANFNLPKRPAVSE